MMKNLRVITFLVFAVCAFCLPAQAQKQWTYKADNGTENEWHRQEITITITQGPNGYEVSGELKTPTFPCHFQGSYVPATEKFEAKSTDCPREIKGFKVKGKDALQITEPFSAVAKREGAKSFSVSGTWRCDDGGTYVLTQSGSSLTWEATSPDNGATWAHTFTGEINNNGAIKGSFKDHPSGIIHQSGRLDFKIISNDRIERTYAEVPFGCSVLVRQR